jgi:hypothetical protein
MRARILTVLIAAVLASCGGSPTDPVPEIIIEPVRPSEGIPPRADTLIVDTLNYVD